MVYAGLAATGETLRVADLLLAPHAPLLIRVFACVFGAAWGSFFGMFAYRWPRDLSIVTPGSRCPACGTPIPVYRNIPIVSFLLQRGKAACCGAKLSSSYLLLELCVALLALAVVEYALLGAPAERPLAFAFVETLTVFAFFAALAGIAFIDLEWMLIPDVLSLSCVALGLVSAPFREVALDAIVIGAGAGYFGIIVPFVWLYEHFTGRRGMGEGDAKLLMAVGAFFGWQAVLFALVAGSIQGVVAYLFAGRRMASSAERERADEGGSGKAKLPFGPFLALGAIEFYFFGEAIVNAYLGMVLGTGS